MPIVVQHSPPLGLVGQVLASALARQAGKADEQQQFENTNTTRRLDQTDQELALRRDRFGYEQENDTAQREHARSMLELNSTLQQDAANLALDRLPARLQAENQARLDLDTAQMTARQKQQMAALDNAELDIRTNARYTPEQRARLQQQVDDRRMQIRSAGAISSASPFPPGKGVGEVWTDEGSGAVFSRDKEGNVKLLVRPDQQPGLESHAGGRMNGESFRKRYDSLRKSMMTVTDTGERRFPSRDEILQSIRDEDAAFAEYAGKSAMTPGSNTMGPQVPGVAATENPAAGAPLTPQAAAGRAAQQSEMDRIIPPNHPFRQLDATDTLPAKAGGVYTAAELAQIARLKHMPIDQVLSVLVQLPSGPRAPRADQPTAAPALPSDASFIRQLSGGL